MVAYLRLRSLNYEYPYHLGAVRGLAKTFDFALVHFLFGGLAGLSRYMRANMLEVIRQELYYDCPRQGIERKGCPFINIRAAQTRFLPAITHI